MIAHFAAALRRRATLPRAPRVNAAFSSLPLDPATLANLDSLGYQRMTPIQAQALPPLLAGHDLIAQAKTGSGKTVAFGLGLLARLDRERFAVQGLVLCPTRELADQVAKALRALSRAHANTKIVTLSGGAPFGPQIATLEHGAHIVVGTPGRILKHLQKRTLNLRAVETVVLDEADRMLDMGFLDDMRTILAATPKGRQTLLFSATYPDEIRALSEQFQREPQQVTIEGGHDAGTIRQRFVEVEKGARLRTLMALLAEYRPASTLIFTNMKQAADELAEELRARGIPTLALHGDLEQKDRDLTLVRFANRSVPVLVATDVAARGIDIEDLEMVVNYDLPRDAEVYVHRIGRTGRAEGKGVAVSLYLASEAHRVLAVEEYLGGKITPEPIRTGAPEGFTLGAPMVTLCIDGGRKEKVRPGDIVGALTAEPSIPAAKVGKIAIFDHVAYVAVDRSVRKVALRVLAEGKIKGRRFKVRALH